MADKTKMKVEIVGSVYDGTQYLNGIVELPEDQAMSLIASGHAKPFNEPKEVGPLENEPVEENDAEIEADSISKKSSKKNK